MQNNKHTKYKEQRSRIIIMKKDNHNSMTTQTINGLLAEIKYAAVQIEEDCKDLHKPFAGMLGREEEIARVEDERNQDHYKDNQV